jgi:hypothetical protein
VEFCGETGCLITPQIPWSLDVESKTEELTIHLYETLTITFPILSFQPFQSLIFPYFRLLSENVNFRFVVFSEVPRLLSAGI